jgi:hypothetical protein
MEALLFHVGIDIGGTFTRLRPDRGSGRGRRRRIQDGEGAVDQGGSP